MLSCLQTIEKFHRGHNLFIKTIILVLDRSVFIVDGTDEIQSEWKRFNGESLPYINWNTEEPNGAGLENCMGIHRTAPGGFVDTSCLNTVGAA